MLSVFIRIIILYAVIIFSIRLMGKRQIGELQPFELVVTIMMSNIATLPIQDSDIPMLTGIIPVLTIVCLDVIVSGFALKSRGFRNFMSGSPKIIISNGRMDQKQMKDLRFTIDDLLAALRAENVFNIDDVQYAIVETTGKISVFPKQNVSPCTPKDMNLDVICSNPQQTVIEDGDIITEALMHINLDLKWVQSILKKERLKLDEVFLLVADDTASYTIIKKELK